MNSCQVKEPPFYQCCCRCDHHKKVGDVYKCMVFFEESGKSYASYKHSVGCEMHWYDGCVEDHKKARELRQAIDNAKGGK